MELTCCVCGRPVAGDAPRLGTRAYCAEHYARVTRNRRSVWRSTGIQILGIVVLAALLALLAGAIEPTLTGSALVLAGIVLALVPAALWLAFFYAQDRLEPEPKGYVLGVFVLGALLAGAIGIPLVRGLFHVQDWLDQGLVVNLLGSILLVGFIQEFLKYAAVRFSVFPLPEFDEWTDGILYGTAAGLGFATVLNIQYVVDSGGVDLGIGVIRIVVTALAQASFAGITGYFLGRAKFEDEPVWWLPLGLTIAAVLNGLFTVVRGSVTRSGSALAGQTANPWYSLLLATLVAALVFAALLFLVRRSIRATIAAGPGGSSEGDALAAASSAVTGTRPVTRHRDRWADWAVIGMLAVALLLGTGAMVLAQGQSETATIAGAGLTVHYPQGWLLKTGQDGDLAFQAVDAASGVYKTTFEVRVVPVSPDAAAIDATGSTTPTLTLVLSNLSLSRAQQSTAYRQIDLKQGANVGGQPAMEAGYVYVYEPGDLFVQQLPVVVHGLDVATVRGDKAYVFSLLAADDVFAGAEKAFRRFVASASLGQP